MDFNNIPDEVIVDILFPFLNLPELYQIQPVSKNFYLYISTVIYDKTKGINLSLIFKTWRKASIHKPRNNSWIRSNKSPDRVSSFQIIG